MPDFSIHRTMMVDTQVRPNDVTKYPLIEAMLTIPREEFVPDARRSIAYSGENLPLTQGRVLLEPRTLAKMIDALDIVPGDLVLDVGCGYGYSAAVLSRLAEAVVAVEDSEEAVREAETRIAATGLDNVAVLHNPLTQGYPQQGPYDAILIGGGGVEEVPEPLLGQLKEGGRVVVLFLEGNLGVVRLGQKVNGNVAWSYVFNAFAPMLPGFARVKGFAL